jgi:hypothetical protein
MRWQLGLSAKHENISSVCSIVQSLASDKGS